MFGAKRNRTLTVRGVIPTSRLASYGNYEYDTSGNELEFSADDFYHDFSVNESIQEDLEFWMSDEVRRECLRLVSAPECDHQHSRTILACWCCQYRAHKHENRCMKDFTMVDAMTITGNQQNVQYRRLGNFKISPAQLRSYVCSNASAVVLKSGGVFPAEFQLPEDFDAHDLINACVQLASESSRYTFENCVWPCDILSNTAFVLPYHGLPIPVYFRPVDTYSPLTRESGGGVNFNNLILLSPPLSEFWRIIRRERSEEHVFDVADKQQHKEEFRNDEAMKSKSSRCLYQSVPAPDVLSSDETCSDSSMNESLSDESNEKHSHCYSPLDDLESFLKDFRPLSMDSTEVDALDSADVMMQADSFFP